MKRKNVQPHHPPANAGFLQSAWQQGWLFALLLVGATVLAYQPVWHAGFIWDDDGFLVNNIRMKDPAGLFRFWFTASSSDYFPMTFSSLWLEYRLWGGHAAGYHWTNLLLHAASAVIWWRVLARLNVPGARLAAAIFALHPVNVESVAWITERKNTLSMFFYAWTALYYLKFEDSGRRRWYWLSALLFALSLLSKTAPVALPIVLLGVAWWRRGRITRQDVLRASVFFGLALVLGLVTIWFQQTFVVRGEVIRHSSFAARLAGAGWALWFYFYKAFLPLNLMFVYPRWHIEAGNILSYLPGVLFLGLVWAGWHYRDRLGKGFLFGLGYFVLMLMPILGFVDNYFVRYSLVTDHWQYFAILAPIAFAAVWLDRAGNFLGRAKPALAGILLLALGILTWRQATMYVDLETFWRRSAAANPHSMLPQMNLGGLLLERGDVTEALVHLQKAAEIDPTAIEPACGLGNAYLRQGQVEQARVCFQRALDTGPNFWEANYGFGTVLLLERQAAEAIPYLKKALAGQPSDVMTANNLGIALVQVGRIDEAIGVLQKSAETNPNECRLQDNLGNALLRKGRMDEGIAHLQKAVELQPGFESGTRDLAFAAWMLATSPDASIRNGARAVELARQAVQADGAKNPMYIATMAAAYAEAGKFTEAIAIAQRAQKLASAQGNTELVEGLQNQIDSYKASTPVRDARLMNAPSSSAP